MQHSLRSPGSRIDFLYPNSRPHSGHFQRLHPATNAGSAWWAIQVLSRTGVSRGKQGLAMMGAGADLVSVKTTRLSGTDVTFITTSPNCLLCQIVWARPLPRIFSFVLSPSNLCFRREISVSSPPHPHRRSVACQDVLVGLLVGHHRNPSPSSVLVCCIASA